MTVLIGVIAGDSARHSLFAACMTKLDTDGVEAEIEWVIGSDWCEARNVLAQMTVEGDYSHLWFMDDDHAFHPQILRQLLTHDVPIVQPICCSRTSPFPLVTYVSSEIGEDGVRRYLPLSLNDEEGAGEGVGLVNLEAGGCAGMLIRRDVLEQFPDRPWFQYGDRSEDIIFCEKVKQAGFHIYADLSCRLGHITTAVVYPEISEGKWMTLLNIGHMSVFVDAAELPPEVDEPELLEQEAREPERTQNESMIKNPCLICGEEAVAHDASGVWCCAEHNGDHEVWKTYYERIEIWYIDTDGRWYGRALNMAGHVVETRLTGSSWTQEADILQVISQYFPGVTIFHISDELQDSRKERRFGPSRLWTRDPS